MENEIRKLREELADVCVKAYNRGLSSGAGGNISVRLEGADIVVVTASGISFRDVTADNLIVVDLECKVLEGEGRPSKEIKWHCGIYKERPEIFSVFHSHSTAATAYASSGMTVPLVTGPFEKNIGKQKIVPYAPPGSDELANLVIPSFKDKELNVLILERHGAVAVAPTLSQAFNLADLLEDAARTAILRNLISNIKTI
ncbi:MAG: class II aldolase/adducin family protein [Candidatus Schekmanbacteria bacterium]|nr:MAG: class II aldolase/adducin family protein [Candidatus Schekmanbacteria bacterium]